MNDLKTHDSEAEDINILGFLEKTQYRPTIIFRKSGFRAGDMVGECGGVKSDKIEKLKHVTGLSTRNSTKKEGMCFASCLKKLKLVNNKAEFPASVSINQIPELEKKFGFKINVIADEAIKVDNRGVDEAMSWPIRKLIAELDANKLCEFVYLHYSGIDSEMKEWSMELKKDAVKLADLKSEKVHTLIFKDSHYYIYLGHNKIIKDYEFV